jgi:hypothetical protein
MENGRAGDLLFALHSPLRINRPAEPKLGAWLIIGDYPFTTRKDVTRIARINAN